MKGRDLTWIHSKYVFAILYFVISFTVSYLVACVSFSHRTLIFLISYSVNLSACAFIKIVSLAVQNLEKYQHLIAGLVRQQSSQCL